MLPVRDANVALRSREDALEIALGLPVRVSVLTTAPAEVIIGALHKAVMPLGNPEVMLRLDPPAPASATTPPWGVSVTVAVAVERDGIQIAWGDTVNRTPGSVCTCSERALFVVRPSPAAETTTVPEVAAPAEEAVSVRVWLLVLTLAEGVCGLADHCAVTPAGRPLSE